MILIEKALSISIYIYVKIVEFEDSTWEWVLLRATSNKSGLEMIVCNGEGVGYGYCRRIPTIIITQIRPLTKISATQSHCIVQCVQITNNLWALFNLFDGIENVRDFQNHKFDWKATFIWVLSELSMHLTLSI